MIMKRQPARVLEPEDVDRLLALTSDTRHPSRNRLIVLLSFKAGLRACEISGLTWPMVLKTNGRIANHLTISRNIAKYANRRKADDNAMQGNRYCSRFNYRGAGPLHCISRLSYALG